MKVLIVFVTLCIILSVGNSVNANVLNKSKTPAIESSWQVVTEADYLAEQKWRASVTWIDLRSKGRKVIKPIKSNNGLEGRITNGHDCWNGLAPYQVGLQLNMGNNAYAWCGGSIIGSNWVVTVSHCTQDAHDVKIFLGSVQRQTGVATSVGRDAMKNHPTDDFAVIWVPTIPFSDNIKPVRLPSRGSGSFEGQHGFATGWGGTASGNGLPDILQYVFLYVISNQKCSETYGHVAPDTLCVETKGGYSICSGDSGGPLVIDNVLIGAARFVAAVEPLCLAGLPAGFARVNSYLDWIYSQSGIQ